MIKTVFEGDTASFLIDVEYNGVLLDATQESQLKYSEIILYSRMDSTKILGKYALRKNYCAEPTAWKEVTAENGKILLIVDSTATTDIAHNEIMMQITNYIVDAKVPGTGIAVETGVSPLLKLKEKVKP